MNDYCKGGQFDGYKLTTDRDHQLCREGGGQIVAGADGGSCAAGTVENFAASSGRPVDANPLRVVREVWQESPELRQLMSLNEIAVPAVERALAEDPALGERLIEGLARASELTRTVVDPATDGAAYTSADHEFFVSLARAVAERAGEPQLSDAVESAAQMGASYVDVSKRELRDRLGTLPDSIDVERSRLEFELPVPVDVHRERDRISDFLQSLPLQIDGPARWVTQPVVEYVSELHTARERIAEKAHALGELAARPLGKVRAVAGGFVQRFENCDIYFSPGTGAHEVHGEIRRKFDLRGGVSLLGLPVTDETGCPDGVGRFNHFANAASIYWTPRTGPFHVAGVVRFRWQSSGWERGPFGYPTQDQQGLSGLYPQDNPDMHWTRFEHGVIFGQAGDAQPAVAATASAQQLVAAIQRMIVQRLPVKTFQLGSLLTVTARPGLKSVKVLGVDDWSYGFYGSDGRVLRVRVEGFVSLPVVPDPTFRADLSLRFGTEWPRNSFTYPGWKDVTATLVSASITVDGVASGTIADAIRQALQDAFTPGADHPEVTGRSMVIATVPTGASQRGTGKLDFLDVMLMEDGSLNLFLNPLPAVMGGFRKQFAQRALDSALENF